MAADDTTHDGMAMAGWTGFRKTSGAFATEKQAENRLDELVQLAACFRVYTEVRGTYIFRRVGAEEKEPRIDRVLVPTAELVADGWVLGPVGVECKRSFVKYGPVISQAMDYTRAVFHLPVNFDVLLRWVFVWPCQHPKGPPASIMAQNRIGWIEPYGHDVRFGCGEKTALWIKHDGRYTVHHEPDCGNKVGSR